eukprot:277491_1
MIQDGSISNSDLATASITSVKIADDSITTMKLSDGSVSSSKILDGTINSVDIAPSITFNDLIVTGSIDFTSSDILGRYPLMFEGDSNDGSTLRFDITNPTTSNTVVFPDEDGIVVLTGSLDTVDSQMITDGSIGSDDLATGLSLSGVTATGSLSISGST